MTSIIIKKFDQQEIEQFITTYEKLGSILLEIKDQQVEE
ncbi:Uncharacterised protein [Mycobacteroides abscessus subsp. abscessus]|nr:Uncharacterised protein [Mycobacteroides abscessus subsp. abscessus]